MHGLIKHLLELDRVLSNGDLSRLWEGSLLSSLSSLGSTECLEACSLILFHGRLQLLLLDVVKVILCNIDDIEFVEFP